MKIFVETYGCSANLNNAELIKGILSKKHSLVDSVSEADLVVLNTCVVKGPTENRMLRRVKDIDKNLIVTGCMPELFKEKIKKLKPGVIILGIKHIKEIEKAVNGKEIIGENKEIKLGAGINSNPNIEIIQISEGCVGDCTYCITKLVKGELFSFPVKDIVKQVKKTKCKEIWLTSQDNGAYGLDIGTDLVHLLKEILKLKKDFKLRIGMINPNHALRLFDGLVEVLKDERVFKFLHLPVQSLSNKVLKDMNRFYSSEDYVSLIEKLRGKIPKITISTDIIVGYPTESLNSFSQTLKLVKKLGFDAINISRYWPRKGTAAYSLKQLEFKVVKKRVKQLKELFEKISLKKNKEWIGWKGAVFVDEFEKNLIGRNFAYKQVILDGSKNLLGKELDVEVVDAGVYFLKCIVC